MGNKATIKDATGPITLAETPKETYDRWMQAVSPEYG